MEKFYSPLPAIEEEIKRRIGAIQTCLEIGPGSKPFSLSTHFVDIADQKDLPNIVVLDVDEDTFPFKERQFDFTYARHVLEDIQSPNHLFAEMVRVSQSGFIETPSPVVELTRYIDGDSPPFRGYLHHRYFFWSDIRDNSLHCIPKYSVLEHAENIPLFAELKTDIFWNNYYFWDNKNFLPKLVMYKHGINFQIGKEYEKLLNQGIIKSTEYARHFVKLKDPIDPPTKEKSNVF
jgi:hypothetical protein